MSEPSHRLRRDFRARMAELEDTIIRMGDRVRDMLDQAVRGLVDADTAAVEAVRASEEVLDGLHAQVRDDLYRTLALQAPVASDLRFLTAVTHLNIHLERMGDLCVNLARSAADASLADEPALAGLVREMGVHARNLLDRAMEAFTRRDAELARHLHALDDPLDRLNGGVFRELVALAGDEARMEWVMRVLLVARYLERFGDHAVECGEVIVFAVTGRAEDFGRPGA